MLSKYFNSVSWIYASFPLRVPIYVSQTLCTMVVGCALCPVYLTARKLNVKYLPFLWYATPQIPAVMGSSYIPPTGSLYFLVPFFFFPSPSPDSASELHQRSRYQPKSVVMKYTNTSHVPLNAAMRFPRTVRQVSAGCM